MSITDIFSETEQLLHYYYLLEHIFGKTISKVLSNSFFFIYVLTLLTVVHGYRYECKMFNFIHRENLQGFDCNSEGFGII